jgi:ABC-type transport system involved in multi-copper enzyme maturation permease subunit
MVLAVAEVFPSTADDGDLPVVLSATDEIGGDPPLPADRGWDPSDWHALSRPVMWEPPDPPRKPLPPVDDERPLLWKEVCVHSISGLVADNGLVVALLASFGGLAALSLFFVALDSRLEAHTALSSGLVKFGTVILGSLLGLGALAHAVNSVARESEKDTLDGLLALPLHRDRILEAKWLGGLLSLRLLAWALAVLWLFGLLTGGLHIVGLVCVTVSVAATVEFLASLGLWLSVTCKTSMRANVAAALCVLLVGCGPWVVSGYIDLFTVRSAAESPTADAIAGAAMPLVAWVRACGPWAEYAKQPAGYYQTLLVGALVYALAAWALWRATLRRFRTYGARRQ